MSTGAGPSTGLARLRDLDHRRRWARARAPVWFLLGIVVLAACLTAAGLVVLALVARAYSLVTGTPIAEVPVWGWAGEATVGLAALAGAVVTVSVALSTLRAGARRVLRDIGARPPGPDEDQRLRNVVEALGLGLGVVPPTLLVIDDPAPNTLATRGWRRRTLVATSGALGLPRDELEALCAHELAHLHARDARWVTAASASLGRTRRAAKVLELVAGALLAVFGIALEGGNSFLISPLLGGLALGALGLVVDRRVGAAQRHLRVEEDEIADVAAILLARHPAALAAVCDRLAADDRQVGRSSWRAELLWFKAVVPDESGDAPVTPAGCVPGLSEEESRRALDAVADVRRLGSLGAHGPGPGATAAVAAAELRHRADAAYANAHLPRPTSWAGPPATGTA